jgi:hypothetical protein
MRKRKGNPLHSKFQVMEGRVLIGNCQRKLGLNVQEQRASQGSRPGICFAGGDLARLREWAGGRSNAR